MGDSTQDTKRGTQADAVDVVEQRLQRHRQHGVADVDGDGNAVIDMHGGFVSAPPGFILDVVVDEEGVVVELQGRGGGQDRLEMAAEPEADRDAQCWAQGLAASARVVEDQVTEAARRVFAAVEARDLAITCLFAQSEVVVERIRRAI